MDQQEQQLIDRIKQAQNVLVTVSASPSVDQLAAAIGLTIALNKLDKHGTAVFSGEVPSTIEFLKPEDTLEKNTDSLRDFIIALDKSKADKLRYKVEDQVVRIFITPYRTSLSPNDLEFSQGDFNVDVVVALGVAEQKDLDQAITSHGRILHDATVATVSTAGDKSDLGTINWVDQGSSSLSEMMLSLIDGLDKSLLDGQIATALLTGIVATTDRFRNEKTTPETMSVSAELMAAGANQQLIATKLEAAPPVGNMSAGHIHAEEGKTADGKPEPGTLAINHEEVSIPGAGPGPMAGPEGEERNETTDQSQDQMNEYGKPGPGLGMLPPMGPGMLPPMPQISNVHAVGEGGVPEPGGPETHHDQIISPPAYGGANPPITPYPEESEPSTEELTLPPMNAPLLSHNQTVLPSSPPPALPSNDNPFIPQAPLPPQLAEEYAPPTPSEQPMPPMPPAPLAPAPAPPAPFTIPTTPMPEPIVPVGASPTPPPASPALPPLSPMPLAPSPMPPIQPMPPAPLSPLAPPAPSVPPAPISSPAPVGPPVSPASASYIPGETLEEIEAAVHSSHVQQPSAAGKPPAPASAPALSENSLNDARSAVKAALSSGGGPSSEPLRPIVALNAQPLGPELHPAPAPPQVTNTGFSEPTPGNTPADATLDMPLPSNPFGPGQPMGPPPMPPGGLPPAPSSGPGAPPPVPPPFFPPQ